MTVKIGDASYRTRRPEDLDAKLLESTGVSAEEMARLMGHGAQPAEVARALHPFLGDDAPPAHDLAAAIRDAGVAEVAGQVSKLYAAAPAKPAPTPSDGAAS